MNIDLMPKFNFGTQAHAAAGSELAQDEEGEPKGVKSLGPRKTRFLTNGQIRRDRERFVKAQERKSQRRYRRDWMAENSARATLRGQVWVLKNEAKVSPDLYANTVKAVVKKYGDVQTALMGMKP